MNTITHVAEAAKKIAAANAFDYAGNYGRGTFRFEVRVQESGDSVTLSAVINAQITKERARTELGKVWDALVREIDEQCATHLFRAPSRNGKKLWLQGFWHMGHFCADGIARSIAVRK